MEVLLVELQPVELQPVEPLPVELLPVELLLEELSDAAASEDRFEQLEDTVALKEAFNTFLGSLKKEQRRIFLLRYWYMDTVGEIAQKLGIGESKVKVSLHRTRGKLKKLLEREGLL